VYNRLVEPLMAGIYAGDGELLSLAATFPQLRALELRYGGLIKGIRASRRGQEAPPNNLPAFLTPLGGMVELVEALEKSLRGATILRGARARAVEGEDGSYHVRLDSGRAVSAESVILATPAYATADLVAGLDAELAVQLRAIPYVSTATVSAVYRARDVPRPLDAYGFIVPRRERRPVLACTWTSTKFPDRAPPAHALIRAFLGRAGADEIVGQTDDALLALVRAELGRTLGITRPPELYRIYRWPRAMPQYTMGHRERVAAIEERLSRHPGLFPAGNAYGGIGIPDAIQSGERAAERSLASSP
jgi:oxygen-dependent protoporphyrinogen oxidase